MVTLLSILTFGFFLGIRHATDPDHRLHDAHHGGHRRAPGLHRAAVHAVHRYLGVASGVLSLVFGLFLAYEIGIVGGLFTGQPTWTPR